MSDFIPIMISTKVAGPAELGVQGAQLRIHSKKNWQLKQAFSRKKNFENLSKNDQVRGKNVNYAPIFQQPLPTLRRVTSPLL